MLDKKVSILPKKLENFIFTSSKVDSNPPPKYRWNLPQDGMIRRAKFYVMFLCCIFFLVMIVNFGKALLLVFFKFKWWCRSILWIKIMLHLIHQSKLVKLWNVMDSMCKTWFLICLLKITCMLPTIEFWKKKLIM